MQVSRVDLTCSYENNFYIRYNMFVETIEPTPLIIFLHFC
jgi:hypothetical protein